MLSRRSPERTTCGVTVSGRATPYLQSVENIWREKAAEPLFARTERVHGAVLREFGKRVEGRSLDAIPAKVASDHYKDLQARVSETTAQIHIRALRAFFNAHKQICRPTLLRTLSLRKSTSRRGSSFAPRFNGIR